MPPIKFGRDLYGTAAIIGTDPGSAELLRVGGSGRLTALGVGTTAPATTGHARATRWMVDGAAYIDNGGTSDNLGIVAAGVNAGRFDGENTGGLTRFLIGVGGGIGPTRVRVGGNGTGVPAGATVRLLYVDYGA